MNELIKIETRIPYLEALFDPWKQLIGKDYEGYRNHVYRMVQYCWALKEKAGEPLSEQSRQKTMIAAVFHDIGIWTDNTLDYIQPSIPPAMQYLKDNALTDWQDEIRLMISEHHKLKPYTGDYAEMVELFRKGDLVDFSLGMVRFDLPAGFIKDMKQSLPNRGFHLGLVQKELKWLLRHPHKPAPMMKC